MVELENVTSPFPVVPSIEQAGFCDDYYTVTYHISGGKYMTKYFNDRTDLVTFVSSIEDKADFFVADYYLHRSLNIKVLLKEAKNK